VLPTRLSSAETKPVDAAQGSELPQLVIAEVECIAASGCSAEKYILDDRTQLIPKTINNCNIALIILFLIY
jgi:hypothetical protein